MSGTYTFTDAQKTDIRRFMGYPSFGNANSGFQAYRFFQAYGFLEFRLNNSSLEEGAVIVNTYLTNLYTLETAIVGATQNLDTDRAAVWYHNKQEIRDRERLFDDWRRRLCGFLGLPPGPALQATDASMIVI